MTGSIEIALKAISTDAARSKETNAFSARLHVDGRFIALIENDGQGGADRVIGPGASGTLRHAMDAYDAAAARVATEMPPLALDDGTSLPMTLELLCATLVERHAILKHMCAEMRRKILFFPDGLPPAGARAPLRAHRLETPTGLSSGMDRILEKLPGAYFINGLEDDQIVTAYKRIS